MNCDKRQGNSRILMRLDEFLHEDTHLIIMDS